MQSEAEAMLLDRYLPQYDVTETHAVIIDPDTDLTWQAVRPSDLSRSAVIRVLLEMRSLPNRLQRVLKRRPSGPVRPPLTLDDMELLEMGAIEPHTGRWPTSTELEVFGIPQGIRQVLARRLAFLSTATAELLQVSAVLGQEFEFTLLNRMTGWEDPPVIEAVEEALRAGVLNERGTSWVASYSFRHALVREVLYSSLSGPRRQGLHLRAAAAIQASGPLDAARVSTVAMHLRLAGPLADQTHVAELSLQASKAAAAVYAWEEAAAHHRAALQALERAGAPLAERAILTERLGVLVYKAGTDLQEGIEHLEWALAAYQAAGDRLAAARVHSRLGMHLTTYPATLNVAAGLAHCQAAEAELARQPDTRQLGYLYVGMANGAVFGVRTGQLEAASQRALELAETLDDEPLAAWASYHRAWWAFNCGRLAESLSLHQRIYDIAARLDDVGMAAWAAFGRALFNGMYLADPLSTRSWCARAWPCRTWTRSPGSATTCSTTWATPKAAAANS